MKNDQEKPAVSSPTCTALLCDALAKYWPVIFVIFVAFVIFVIFGKVAINDAEYKKNKTEFKIKCENKGGVMFVPSGVRGWPRPECRNPNAMIDIDT